MPYILQIIIFILALLGVLFNSVKTDESRNNIYSKHGQPSLTKAGRMIIVLLFVSVMLSLFSTYRISKEAQEQTYQSRKEVQELKRALANVRLERDLSGVEVSFTPSAQHWSEIANVYDNMPNAPVSGFSYSASTITAERVGDHWKIDFSPVKVPEGTIRLGTIFTNQPDGKGFEEVINKALVELLIKWGNGAVIEISSRDNYPSSITISRDMIAYTFYPPAIRLNLAKLNADPTITFRGNAYPSSIRVHSIDESIMFDETINLSWIEKGGDAFSERLMPYISGPHPLNITFKTFSP